MPQNKMKERQDKNQLQVEYSLSEMFWTLSVLHFAFFSPNFGILAST